MILSEHSSTSLNINTTSPDRNLTSLRWMSACFASITQAIALFHDWLRHTPSICNQIPLVQLFAREVYSWNTSTPQMGILLWARRREPVAVNPSPLSVLVGVRLIKYKNIVAAMSSLPDHLTPRVPRSSLREHSTLFRMLSTSHHAHSRRSSSCLDSHPAADLHFSFDREHRESRCCPRVSP